MVEKDQRANKARSIGTRLLRAMSSLALLGGVVYVAVAGFNLAATLVLVAAFGGVAVPAVMAADSALECVTGFFEVFVEGLLSVVSVLCDLVGSILG